MPGTKRLRRRESRRGTATVEFALIAPVLLIFLLGMSEASRLMDIQNRLAAAARQGARLAAMDREGIVADETTTNEKMEEDIRNFLTATGLPGAELTVKIAATPADLSTLPPVHETDLDSLTPIDLDSPDSAYDMFQIVLELPYSALCQTCPPGADQMTLRARIVCRNAKSSIVQ